MGRGGNSAEGTSTIARGWLGRARRGVAELLPERAEAWEVGGSLRDEALGREPKDLDVAVSGIGVEELLEACRLAGRAEPLEVAGQLIGARLWAPFTPDGGVELALARTESSTGPGHSDFAIDAGCEVSIDDDLARRDFTCNSVARRINRDGTPGEVHDPFGGLDDIRAGLLRQTHPWAMQEDPLRVLRGLARMAKDGLVADEDTTEAMRSEAHKLGPDGALSSERIFEELEKLLSGDRAAAALRFARDNGIYAEVFPELAPTIGFEQRSRYHALNVDDHCLKALERACEQGASARVRWAALLHDCGKPSAAWEGPDGNLHFYRNPDDPDALSHEEAGTRIASDLLERLRAPRKLEKDVTWLVSEHMYANDSDFSGLNDRKQGIRARRFIARCGRERAEDLMLLRRVDRASKFERPAEGWDSEIDLFERRVRAEWNSPITLSEMAIGGNDLIGLGLEGPRIGAVLAELNHRVVVDPDSNYAERLLGWAEGLAAGPAG